MEMTEGFWLGLLLFFGFTAFAFFTGRYLPFRFSLVAIGFVIYGASRAASTYVQTKEELGLPLRPNLSSMSELTLIASCILVILFFSLPYFAHALGSKLRARSQATPNPKPRRRN